MARELPHDFVRVRSGSGRSWHLVHGESPAQPLTATCGTVLRRPAYPENCAGRRVSDRPDCTRCWRVLEESAALDEEVSP